MFQSTVMKQACHFNYRKRIIKCNTYFIVNGLSNLRLRCIKNYVYVISMYINNYETEMKKCLCRVERGTARCLAACNCTKQRSRRLSVASASDNASARTRVIKFIPFSPESA